MAAPVAHNATGDYSTNGPSSASTSVVGLNPANTASGDILMACLFTTDNGVDFTGVPSGWQKLPGTAPETTIGNLRWYGLDVTAQGGPSALPSSWTWTTSASDRYVAIIFRVTGAALGLDSIGAAVTVGATTAMTIPQTDPVSTTALLLAAVAYDLTSGAAPTPSTPTGMTQLVQGSCLVTGSGAGSSLTIFSQTLASGAATGTRSTTASATPTNGAGYLITLAPAGSIPIANAGPDQINVVTGKPVMLDGSGSSIGSGTIGYAWTQVGGAPTVAITGGSTVSPEFEAPGTLAGTTLTFQLIVTDGTLFSSPDTVAVTVLPHSLWLLEGALAKYSREPDDRLSASSVVAAAVEILQL